MSSYGGVIFFQTREGADISALGAVAASHRQAVPFSFFIFQPATQEEVMKAKYQVALAMVGSFALGAVAVESLRAQAKPFGYIVAEVGVADPEGFTKEFLPPISKSIQEMGGKFLVRGGKTVSLDGAPPQPRVVILQMESLERAQAWWNSQATKDAFAIGKKYVTFRDFAVEGLSQFDQGRGKLD